MNGGVVGSRAALLAAALAVALAVPARAEVRPELAAEIERTRAAYPGLLSLAPGDRFLVSVDDAALASLLDAVRAGRWSGELEAALGVAIEGLSRAQGPAATHGRFLLGEVAGRAAASGSRETLRGATRLLERFLEDQTHEYSLLAQELLAGKLRCGAASLGDRELVERIGARTNVDRERGLAGTDGTVADRYGLHERAGLYSVAARGSRVIAVGYFGTAVVSNDGGESWQTPATGTDEPLFAVALGPGDEVWAAGRAGALIRSADGGRSFARRATPFERHVLGLLAPRPGEALAVGDFGLQIHTTDGGDTWKCLPREEDVVLGRIVRAGDDAALAGEFGTLERLPGGMPPGRRGVLHGVPEDLYVFDVWFDEPGRIGVAVGLEGAILRSDDAGASWQRVRSDFDADLAGVGGSGERVVVAGEGGFLAVSSDGGASFTRARSPALPFPLADVELADSRRAFAVGPRGLVLRSDDGGESFRAVRGAGAR